MRQPFYEVLYQPVKLMQELGLDFFIGLFLLLVFLATLCHFNILNCKPLPDPRPVQTKPTKGIDKL